ncbi:MAG: D-alanyl-D-alanine carboxypeptidase, partial [Candidatus Fermentibacter daniensis]
MIPAIMLTISALFAAIPQPAPAWRTGMLAIDAGTGETILESRSDELFRPASTVKLITTLLAFRTLGPSRIILTHVVADHAAGAVYLIGSGAPLIEPDDIERAAVEASAELGGGSWRLFFDT